MLKVEEIPPECGLMEVSENGNVAIKVTAPYRNTAIPSWLFLASICRKYDKHRAVKVNLAEAKKEAARQGFECVALILDEHIKSYKNFANGNKFVPNQIATALTKVYYEMVEELTKKGHLGADLLRIVENQTDFTHDVTADSGYHYDDRDNIE
jgi:hypothetical protein